VEGSTHQKREGDSRQREKRGFTSLLHRLNDLNTKERQRATYMYIEREILFFFTAVIRAGSCRSSHSRNRRFTQPLKKKSEVSIECDAAWTWVTDSQHYLQPRGGRLVTPHCFRCSVCLHCPARSFLVGFVKVVRNETFGCAHARTDNHSRSSRHHMKALDYTNTHTNTHNTRTQTHLRKNVHTPFCEHLQRGGQKTKKKERKVKARKKAGVKRSRSTEREKKAASTSARLEVTMTKKRKRESRSPAHIAYCSPVSHLSFLCVLTRSLRFSGREKNLSPCAALQCRHLRGTHKPPQRRTRFFGDGRGISWSWPHNRLHILL
jgi:hypothetical protein